MTRTWARVLANPVAGEGRARRWVPHVLATCRRWGWELDIRWTRGPGHAAELAATSDADEVLVVGGDGTAAEAAAGLLQRDRPGTLAVLPAGSGNDFARALGWPVRLRAALATLRRSDPRRVDVLRVADRIGLVGLGVGLEAWAVMGAARVPRILRRLRYLVGLARTWGRLQAVRTTLLVDDRAVWEGSTVLVHVANGPTQGGGVPLCPPARLDDGRLHLVWARTAQRRTVAALVPRALAGRHLDHPAVGYAPGSRCTIVVDGTVPAHLDGELLPRGSEWSITLARAALLVRGPAREVHTGWTSNGDLPT